MDELEIKEILVKEAGLIALPEEHNRIDIDVMLFKNKSKPVVVKTMKETFCGMFHYFGQKGVLIETTSNLVLVPIDQITSIWFEK